jgi:hypothetical protein
MKRPARLPRSSSAAASSSKAAALRQEPSRSVPIREAVFAPDRVKNFTNRE